jgi:hypothetical protein
VRWLAAACGDGCKSGVWSTRCTTDALNPGLFDPFCPTNDVTLDNPAYRVLGISLMTGKLDWVLLPRGRVEVVAQAMGNHSYSLSDHKWLMVEVRLL